MVTSKKQKHFLDYLPSLRFWLAGPVTLIVSILTMASMSLFLPKGKAEIDHLVIPVVIFPLIWATLFFYTVLEKNSKRAGLVMLGLFICTALLVTAAILGWVSA